MDGLTVNIGWEYFLGILAGLIAIAWYSGGRFNKIETDVTWLKETLRELKLSVETIGKPQLFEFHSPVQLVAKGIEFLEKTGLKKYLDDHFESDFAFCQTTHKMETAYDVQKAVFSFMEDYEFDKAFCTSLKDFVYEEGISMDVARRIGAIYVRDKCLVALKMDGKEIDTQT